MKLIINDVIIKPYAYAMNKDITEIIINNAVKIGDRAFSGCKRLKNIIINSKLESIGSGAFKSCKNIDSINLPSSLKYIDNEAFECASFPHEIPDCKYGTSVFKRAILPEKISIPKNMAKIPAKMFEECITIKSVNCGNVEIIEDLAFINCNHLKHVNFGKNLKKIGEKSFYNCRLVGINFPETLEYIGDSAFENNFFKKLILPDNIKHLGVGVFDTCENLNYIKFPKMLEYIPDNVFSARNITTIIWPENVKEIGAMTMAGSEKIDCFTLPEIEEIKRGFFRFSKFKKVVIPNTVIKISNDTVFYEAKIDKLFIPSTIKNLNSQIFYGFKGNIYFDGPKEEFTKKVNLGDLNKETKVFYRKTVRDFIDEGYTFKEAQSLYAGKCADIPELYEER